MMCLRRNKSKIIGSARMWSTTPVTIALALALRKHSTVSISSILMDPIVKHPAVAVLQLDKRPRRKLKGKHKHLFPKEEFHGIGANNENTTSTVHILNELGALACETGVVPRKELFETYAAALYMHTTFPNLRRVADLAGGHGLLSWFLLVLDPTRTRSAVVVDRCMPDSAEIISEAMIRRFPELESQWDYVVADLSCVEAHPSTLLASVHACGALSDYLVELSVESGAPLAVAPCCHTVQADKGYRPHVLSGMNTESVVALVNQNKKNGGTSLADVVDNIRCDTLQKAGYIVKEAKLPSIFTERNRLILAELDDDLTNSMRPSMVMQRTLNPPEKIFFERRKTNSGTPKVPKVRIPLSDDPKSIAQCRAISGKHQAAIRLMQTIPRHYSPTFEVSLFLPNSNDTTDHDNMLQQATREEVENSLQKLASKCCDKRSRNGVATQSKDSTTTTVVECNVQLLGDGHLDQSTGRMSQTYRLQYRAPEGTSIDNMRIPKEIAKEIHHQFLHLVDNDLGLEVR